MTHISVEVCSSLSNNYVDLLKQIKLSGSKSEMSAVAGSNFDSRSTFERRYTTDGQMESKDIHQTLLGFGG